MFSISQGEESLLGHFPAGPELLQQQPGDELEEVQRGCDGWSPVKDPKLLQRKFLRRNVEKSWQDILGTPGLMDHSHGDSSHLP